MEEDCVWNDTAEDVGASLEMEYHIRCRMASEWKETQLAKGNTIFKHEEFLRIPLAFFEYNICFEESWLSRLWAVPTSEVDALKSIHKAFALVLDCRPKDGNAILGLPSMGDFMESYAKPYGRTSREVNTTRLTNLMRVHYHQMVFNRLGNRKLNLTKLNAFNEKLDMLCMAEELR
jgi:hypothetical protein